MDYNEMSDAALERINGQINAKVDFAIASIEAHHFNTCMFFVIERWGLAFAKSRGIL